MDPNEKLAMEAVTDLYVTATEGRHGDSAQKLMEARCALSNAFAISAARLEQAEKLADAAKTLANQYAQSGDCDIPTEEAFFAALAAFQAQGEEVGS